MSNREVSRRDFLTGAAVVTAGVAATSLIGCSKKTAAAYLPEKWDGEADIVVVGTGGAGLAAAITAQKENLGSVLVLEAAPKGQEGGNTRVCSQIMFMPTPLEAAITYQTNLNGAYVVEPELIKTWATNIGENLTWMKGVGIELTEVPILNPEFPDVAGGKESAHCYCLGGLTGIGNSVIWNAMKKAFDDAGATITYDSRVTKLIFDPTTKEVFGVGTKDGRNFKAKKGVVLACGGFENDRELKNTYYAVGFPEIGFFGSPYNRGDGIRMAEAIGAQLWHMNNFAGPYFGPRFVTDKQLPAEMAGSPLLSYAPLGFGTNHDYIFVGLDGRRYINEDTVTLARHGKVWAGGTYVMQRTPTPAWAIVGQKSFTAGAPVSALWAGNGWANTMKLNPSADNAGYLANGTIVKCNTIADIATATKIPVARLTETLTNYNKYVAAQSDPEFHRGEPVYLYGVSPLDTPTPKPAVAAFALEPITAPYYVHLYYGGILNSQGGPKRDTSGGVVGLDGNSIPRLYGSGELGTEYSYNYNGGGNISAAISSGRLAARSVGKLTAWDAKK
ncbi:MAG: FAD-binding protein [Coriobacteriia bacterium]|nr:FAD-binding protein [Coriobacteriia bacterium]